MAHTHEWEVCGETGMLRHQCPDGCWKIEKHEHRKEPFITHHYTKAHLTPPKPKLDPNISYQKTGRLVSAFFNKGGLFLKNTLPHYSDQSYGDYIDTIARDNLANNIRTFLYWHEHPEVNMPHVKTNGKYELHEINPIWWNQVKWRVEYAIERGLTIRLILNDQSALRYHDKHWIHPNNNWGWNGKPLYYDRYGWTHWHHYADRPDRCTAEEAERYAATRDYLLNGLYAKIIPPLEQYKPYVMWENNEIDMGANGHNAHANILNDYGIPRSRRITSPRGEEWLATKPTIARKWIPEMHGINTVQLYDDAKEYEPTKPWLPSGDGFGEKWNDVGNAEICNVLLRSLRDGNLGYTGNTEGKWDDINWSTAQAMMKTFRGWLEL